MDGFVRRVRDIRIGDKYQLLLKLGSGSFGKVYLGRDVDTGEEVALKLEHHSIGFSLLYEEVQVYEDLVGEMGFPRIFWHGRVHDFQVLVFELLGPNLEDLFRYCGNQFSLKTTLMLADQLLRRFEVLHSHQYLHRDIKPENFLLGTGRHGNVVYMTDLGLAVYRQTPFSDSKTVAAKIHDRPVRAPRLLGTCRYASINGHLGVAQSPRDDLEALGYMLVYFRKGRLPWQGLKSVTGEAKYLHVLEMKQEISVEELCADLPPEFARYMHYVRQLQEDERPDYRHLRKLFNDLFKRRRFQNDEVFDWTIREFNRLEAELRPTSAVAGVEEKRSPDRDVNGFVVAEGQ